MARGGAGAAVGAAVRRSAPAALVAAVTLLAAGCTGSAAEDRAAAPSPTASTSSAKPTNAEVCTIQVRYWSRTLLTEGEYEGGDYQHMGLSDAQNEVLRALLAEVGPLAQAEGVPAAMAVVEREAPARCELAYAGGTPTNAWG